MPLESLPKMNRRVQSDNTKYLVRQLTCLLIYNQISSSRKKRKKNEKKRIKACNQCIPIDQNLGNYVLRFKATYDQIPTLHRKPPGPKLLIHLGNIARITSVLCIISSFSIQTTQNDFHMKILLWIYFLDLFTIPLDN
jgi:hypothetical protein